MKQIGAAIGVNESRVSQLHARAIQRLRKALGADCSAAEAAAVAAPGDPVVPADDAPDEDGEGERQADTIARRPWCSRTRRPSSRSRKASALSAALGCVERSRCGSGCH